MQSKGKVADEGKGFQSRKKVTEKGKRSQRKGKGCRARKKPEELEQCRVTWDRHWFLVMEKGQWLW